jgi:hypothetical protein
MLKARHLISSLGLIAAFALAQPATAETRMATVTVCQLYATRAAPSAIPVRVQATAWVALRHGGSLLQDSHCPKSAIGFRFADEARDRPKVKQFSDAMTGDVMNLKPRIFDVRLIGVYTGPTAAEPRGLFVVNDVEGFHQRQ